MDLAALELLDVDDVEVVETDELLAGSASPGVVHPTAPHHHRHCTPSCSAPHCHPISATANVPPTFCGPFHTHAVEAAACFCTCSTCGPVHTHAVGELPDGPLDP